MASQPQEILPDTPTIDRAPRLFIGHHNNDSAATREKTERSSSQHPTSVEGSNTISAYDSQFDNKDTSSDICIDNGPALHSASLANEERECKSTTGLGQASDLIKGMCERVEVVEEQFTSMELQEYSTSDTATDHLRGCQQY